jgi:ATP-dependent Clp protease protease subunit
MPGDDSAQWVDYIIVYTENEFYFLCQNLDDELANQLIGIMLYLNSENK